jgi:hypothetical protein
MDILLLSKWWDEQSPEFLHKRKQRILATEDVLLVIQKKKIIEVLTAPGFSLRTNFLLFDGDKNQYQSSAPLDRKLQIFLFFI